MYDTPLISGVRRGSGGGQEGAGRFRRAKGERIGRKWGTGHRMREGEGKLGVLSASLPLLAQEDP
eukprot:1185271-Prorocentrum_minimum.AAC.1